MDVLRMTRQWWLWIWCALCAASMTARAPGQEIQLPEEQAKAVYLVNLTKYLEWPAEAFADKQSPIVIGVMGEQRLRDELKKLAAAAHSAPRPIKVQAVYDELPATCHILFIPGSEERRLNEMIEKAKGRSLLTISEVDRFLQAGGMLNFARRDRKLRLQVNLPAVEGARIKVSSKLLQVSDVIGGK